MMKVTEWLKLHLQENDIPGLEWIEADQFRVDWDHCGRRAWSPRRAQVFIEYARYRDPTIKKDINSFTNTEVEKYKQRFRVALGKYVKKGSVDIVKDERGGSDPHRVYRFKPAAHPCLPSTVQIIPSLEPYSPAHIPRFEELGVTGKETEPPQSKHTDNISQENNPSVKYTLSPQQTTNVDLSTTNYQFCGDNNVCSTIAANSVLGNCHMPKLFTETPTYESSEAYMPGMAPNFVPGYSETATITKEVQLFSANKLFGETINKEPVISLPDVLKSVDELISHDSNASVELNDKLFADIMTSPEYTSMFGPEPTLYPTDGHNKENFGGLNQINVKTAEAIVGNPCHNTRNATQAMETSMNPTIDQFHERVAYNGLCQTDHQTSANTPSRPVSVSAEHSCSPEGIMHIDIIARNRIISSHHIVNPSGCTIFSSEETLEKLTDADAQKHFGEAYKDREKITLVKWRSYIQTVCSENHKVLRRADDIFHNLLRPVVLICENGDIKLERHCTARIQAAAHLTNDAPLDMKRYDEIKHPQTIFSGSNYFEPSLRLFENNDSQTGEPSTGLHLVVGQRCTKFRDQFPQILLMLRVTSCQAYRELQKVKEEKAKSLSLSCSIPNEVDQQLFSDMNKLTITN